MRPRGEHLDRLEAVRRDVHEMLAAEAFLVEQVCGDAEFTVQTTYSNACGATLAAGVLAAP
jgi:hypothetical protein